MNFGNVTAKGKRPARYQPCSTHLHTQHFRLTQQQFSQAQATSSC